MKFFVDFYKGLDAVNLLIFWGVIIVVLLLLVFAIIITNKNRKLERIIEKSGIDIDNFDGDDELAIKKMTNNQTITEEKVIEKEEKEIIEEKEPVKNEPIIIEPKQENNNETTITEELTSLPQKEEKFIAEEHVMEYQNEIPKTPNIKTEEPVHESKATIGPYQRNILRDVYSNQTSPIGISKNNDSTKSEIYKAAELHESLNDESIRKEENPLLNQKKYVDTYNQNTRKGDYLAELSKKLSDANANDDGRTAYEIQQEEDAIISYEELMQKKDSIKTIDEEDAVISIDELIKKKREQEKLYNITNDEENDEFINELKHFRSDL